MKCLTEVKGESAVATLDGKPKEEESCTCQTGSTIIMVAVDVHHYPMMPEKVPNLEDTQHVD